ncbi:MAG: DUF2256 domain-containing protein [Verrucomicrobia bacterium]|nr:DUF2256 domain-containing protein [Verrucomicrobiota bacterium]
MRRKGDLPTKTCVTCGRPFAWRKKWERCWEEVLTCSERCRRVRRGSRRGGGGASAPGAMP